MTYNHKMIFYCQRCNLEHDRTYESMFDLPVYCDSESCNGFVISPSGRSTIKVSLTANLYIIVGYNKTAWIVAETKEDAIEHFVKEVEKRYHQIEKMTEEEAANSSFFYDPESEGNEEDFIQLSGRDCIVFNENLPAVVYSITNEELEELKRKLEDDFKDGL